VTIIDARESRAHPGRHGPEEFVAGLRMRYVSEAGKNAGERRRRLTGSAIFELMEFHHWTLAETVAVVGVSLETARRYVRQYRTWLRDHLRSDPKPGAA
jgi:hypothetical protein